MSGRARLCHRTRSSARNPDAKVPRDSAVGYSPGLPMPSTPGVACDATCHRTVPATGRRPDGPPRGRPVRDRPATRPAGEHGPCPGAPRPVRRGRGSVHRRSGASLRRLWPAPRPGPAPLGGGPGPPPLPPPLGGDPDPGRIDPDRPGGRGPLGSRPEALAAEAWPGPGPTRPAPVRVAPPGRAAAPDLAGRCRRPEAAGRRPDDLLAAGGR
jgi:hypothetical protein